MDQSTKVSADDFDRDQVDQELRRMFAEVREPLNAESFERQFALRKQQAQRMQGLRRLVLLATLLAFVALLASPLIANSIALGRWLIESQSSLGQLLISRVGWVCSLLVAACILLRFRAFKF